VVSSDPSEAEVVELDEDNESEMARHGITAAEAVQVLNNGPIWVPNKRRRAAVWLAIGFTDGGRALTLPVVYDEDRRSVRPVTGWDSTKGEQTKYL
jgi:uncharacterized DUF497 family protein